MTEFFITMLIWLGLLDPTASYTVGQVQEIATANATAIEQAIPTVDTTLTSWTTASAQQRDIIIIDPRRD